MSRNCKRSSLDGYSESLAAMRRLRNGRLLADAARAVLHQLGHGPVVLLSESAEGIALVGAVSAIRDEPTDWAPLELRKGARQERFEGRVVVIEPVPLAAGLLEAIERSHPGAEVLAPSSLRELVAA